ncbi:hypothetical protein CEXT_592861 [Caerostris extrusa]|uniref:Uncharacterized protein n=1 Tax=Caerostris extrusa TaxID=172846 RepID=A0AAV4UNL9_CAEEX|nr:hypothetical protein CEXT_592861 [Caerostris extrusa]
MLNICKSTLPSYFPFPRKNPLQSFLHFKIGIFGGISHPKIPFPRHRGAFPSNKAQRALSRRSTRLSTKTSMYTCTPEKGTASSPGRLTNHPLLSELPPRRSRLGKGLTGTEGEGGHHLRGGSNNLEDGAVPGNLLRGVIGCQEGKLNSK